MPGLEDRKECLVDGSHCDGRSKKALGTLSGPEPVFSQVFLLVVASDRAIGQDARHRDIVYSRISGHGKNYRWSVLGTCEVSRDVAKHPRIDLACSYSCRQSEVEGVDSSFDKQPDKPGKCCLCFP
jgi:hypothetical protein